MVPLGIFPGSPRGTETEAQPESGKVILAALKGDSQAQDMVGPPASEAQRSDQGTKGPRDPWHRLLKNA